MTKITSIQQCKEVLQKLKDNGYTYSGGQYDWYSREGHHAFFICDNKPEIELYTYIKEVQDMIIAKNLYDWSKGVIE